MSFFKLKTAILALFIACSVGMASAEEPAKNTPAKEEVETPTGVGPEKGVTEATKAGGFKLSAKAIAGLGVKDSAISAKSGKFEAPLKGLLSFQDEGGFYRLRQGFYKLVELKPSQMKKDPSRSVFQFSSAEVKEGDHIATEGAELLRLTDLNIWGGEESGE